MKRLLALFSLLALVFCPLLSQAQNLGKQTYVATSATKRTVTSPSTNPFFSICGSSTKTLRVRQVVLDYTIATAAIHADPILQKTSTATSSGTAVALTAVPLDSNYAAATPNLLNVYTAAATTGTVVGTVAIQYLWGQVTGTVTAGSVTPRHFLFRSLTESDAVVLRGTAQCLQAAFGTAPGNDVTYAVSVFWTEE